VPHLLEDNGNIKLSHADAQKPFHGKQVPDVLEDKGSIKLLSPWWREPVHLAVTAVAITMTAAAGRGVFSPEVVATVAVIAAAAILVVALGTAVQHQPRQPSKASYSPHWTEPTPSPQLASVEQEEPKQMRHAKRKAEVVKRRESACCLGC